MIKKAVLLLSFTACIWGQAFRSDPTPVMTTSGTAPVGGFPALYAVAGAQIEICADAACQIPVTTYTNALGNVACPITAQVTLPGSSLCTPYAGAQGQFGFWLVAGTYYYTITIPSTGKSFGPYPLSAPASSASWLNIANSPVFDVRSSFNSSAGAKCDGTTNDLVSIQAAVNAAQQVGGGSILMCPLKQAVSGTISLAGSHLNILGNGGIIQELIPNVDVIQVGNNSNQVSWDAVYDLQIFGPSTVSAFGYGVDVQFANNILLQDVTVIGTAGGVVAPSNRTLWRGIHFMSCFFCQYSGGSQTSIYGTVDKGMVWEGTVSKASGNLSIIGQPSIVTTGSDGLFIGNYVGGTYISQLDEYGIQNAWEINIDVTTPGSSCCMHLWNGDLSVAEADGGLNAGAINVFGTTLNMWGTNIYGTANGSNPRAAIAINSTGELMSSGLTFVGGAGPVIDNSGLLELSGGSLNGAGNVGPALISEASSIGSIISGVKFYQWQSSTPIITLNPAASNISICGNSFAPTAENFTVWAPVSGTYPPTLSTCANQGVDDISATVASGANINPGTSPHIFVSGTAAIGNISSGWYGRKEDFTFTDPAPGGFSSIGSNVVTTVSAVQNQTISCYFQPPITVAIIGATNASPIVITTASPHGLLSATPVTIAGVLGNTAANGSNFAKTATFTATTFGLYSNIGLSTPVSGNGAFTAGGTLTYGGNVWYCK